MTDAESASTGGHGGTHAIVAAFIANLGIALSKFVAFLVTGSAAMLAEAVHSFADTGNQGLLLLGARKAKRPPDERHPFGHGTERYFWAFVVAMVLFTLGAAFAIVEGIEKIRRPHDLESPAWAIAVLVVAIVLESLSFRTAYRETRHVYPDGSLWRFIRRARAPELPVVLLEDTAALAGLICALTAIILSLATGDGVWDGYGTLAIGLILAAVAGILANEMKSLLIGEAALPEDQERIRTAIEGEASVRRLIHIRTMHLGPEELLVTAKVDFDPSLHGSALAAAIDTVEARVRAVVPSARLIFLEPDVFHPDAPQDGIAAAH